MSSAPAPLRATPQTNSTPPPPSCHSHPQRGPKIAKSFANCDSVCKLLLPAPDERCGCDTLHHHRQGRGGAVRGGAGWSPSGTAGAGGKPVYRLMHSAVHQQLRFAQHDTYARSVLSSLLHSINFSLPLSLSVSLWLALSRSLCRVDGNEVHSM